MLKYFDLIIIIINMIMIYLYINYQLINFIHLK